MAHRADRLFVTAFALLVGATVAAQRAPQNRTEVARPGGKIPGAIMLSLVMSGLIFLQQDTPVWLLLIAHIVLSIGLALMFTPLFTVSLGSLPPNLYSHGSAVLGAAQQVAGAAGTALFVAVMTLRAAALSSGPVARHPTHRPASKIPALACFLVTPTFSPASAPRPSTLKHSLLLEYDPNMVNVESGCTEAAGATLDGLFRRSARLFATRTAVVDPERGAHLSYEELDRRTNQVANSLLGWNLRRGDRVSVWLPNRLENVVVQLACSRNGYVCNPSLHQNYTVAEIVTLLSRIECRALFAQPGYGADAKTADIFERGRKLVRG